jgi:DNA helicase-2/ATP-dependent DNA helicase PcrA
VAVVDTDAADGADGGGELVQAVVDVLTAAGWKPEPPAGTGAVRTRWESLRALADLAADMAATRPVATLADFVADLQERAAVQHAPVADGVTLATLHAAKGLEWDAVFLVGLVEGTVPIVHAETAAEIDEEARLLYVGLTRAREHCTLSWAYARNPGGRQSRTPSRFLDQIAPSSAPETRSARPKKRRDRGPTPCRVCGRTLFPAAERKLGRCESCPSSADEVVFDRLRAWRSTVAAEAKLPAYCVFTDSTLLAIAESLPADTAELARIPGVGRVKLERYGETVLDLLGARDA